MSTVFGKALRKLRIDHELRLKDMAAAIGVSSAFLSAVETGRKKIPAGFVEKISGAYGLGVDDRHALEEAFEKTLWEVRIDLTRLSPVSRGLALTFAKQFDTLGVQDQERLLDFFKDCRCLT
jgi:transcriptional regulator with XRE-family HTH domain